MTEPASPQQEVTQLLSDWRSGDATALEKLIPLVQPELQRLAHRYMSRETMEEIAEVLNIHVNTVMRDWRAAKAWLFAALSGENLDAV